jgi:hypothetical protein
MSDNSDGWVMSDLLKKLNTLVRSNLNDLTPNMPGLPGLGRAPNLDAQVSELRGRINAALAHEEGLQATAGALRAEIEQLDQRADDAVASGQDAQARHLIAQMGRVQQRLALAESDLELHRRAVADLISKVNLLEATVADSKAATTPPSAAPAATNPQPAEIATSKADDASMIAPVERIGALLRQTGDLARERIDTLNAIINARAGEGAPVAPPTDAAAADEVRQAANPADEQALEPTTQPTAQQKPIDEMERRLQRLSRPTPPTGPAAPASLGTSAAPTTPESEQ